MVVTIEPIVVEGTGRSYLARDRWTVKTSDGMHAAHHEHTLLIGRDGARVLTRL